MGRYLMTENDAQAQTVFPDEIAFGGWNVDLHTVGGLLAPTSEPTAAAGYDQTSPVSVNAYLGPYGIPLRILVAKDADNLMMAGRNVSVTHAALGTVRVQATTALMGQAAGTAAAVALCRGQTPAEVADGAATVVQQTLLRDGCFLPNYRNGDPLDLARSAAVTASSEARLCGAGLEPRPGLPAQETLEDDPSADHLHQRRGQWLAVGTEGGRLSLQRVAVCLSNPSAEVQRVPAKLVPAEHIWDYRAHTGEALAETVLQVPPGRRQWVSWEVGLDEQQPETAATNRYLRLDLLANPEVRWHRAGSLEPGHLSAFEMTPGRLRRYGHGLSMSFRAEPPQRVYRPENVLSGVTRPHRGTNVWRSDPSEPLPAWLELAWPAPQHVGHIELTFAGNLLHEYGHEAPLYSDPQCVKAYGLEVRQEGTWREVVRVENNYQRHRRHPLHTPVTTDRLRLVVYATHGDPSAALYEVRCYAPS